MKEAIRGLLDDEPARLRMVEASWQRAQSLRWEHSVRRLETIYLGWLEEWKQRGSH